MAEVYKCNPRINPAVNGIILNWDEYAVSKNTYDNRVYIGNNSKVFTTAQAVDAVTEMLQIEAEGSTYAVKAATMPKGELGDSPMN